MALVPCLTKHVLRENQDYVSGESEFPPPRHGPWPLLCPVPSNRQRASGPQGGSCLYPFHPEKPSARCPQPWAWACPWCPGEEAPDEG